MGVFLDHHWLQWFSLVCEPVEEDEMEGEQEYFMRLDVFIAKFGAPAKEKIVPGLFVFD